MNRFLQVRPQRFQYTTFDDQQMTLYAWSGRRVAFLTPTAKLDPVVMGRLLTVFDDVYDYYHAATGREPEPGKTFHGRDTIAIVDCTCGAGCGYLGATGIELLKSTFETLYTGVRDRNQFDQALFYEFGRNFWFYGDQVEYKTPDDGDSVVTGYAVFMRFMAMDATGVRPGPFNGVDPRHFRSIMEGLVERYEANPSLNWNNTLRINQPPRSPLDLHGTDLFASFMMHLEHAFSPDFPARLWPAVAARPQAATSQQAVDNLFLAACAAAGGNLFELFSNHWRWPISDDAREEANSKFGPPGGFPGLPASARRLSPRYMSSSGCGGVWLTRALERTSLVLL